MRQGAAGPGGAADFHRRHSGWMIRRQVVEHQLGVPGDHREQIVEFLCNAARQPPHGGGAVLPAAGFSGAHDLAIGRTGGILEKVNPSGRGTGLACAGKTRPLYDSACRTLASSVARENGFGMNVVADSALGLTVAVPGYPDIKSVFRPGTKVRNRTDSVGPSRPGSTTSLTSRSMRPRSARHFASASAPSPAYDAE